MIPKAPNDWSALSEHYREDFRGDTHSGVSAKTSRRERCLCRPWRVSV